MKPSFRKAGSPASHNSAIPALRTSALPILMLATTALAGCATTNPPPEISYDNAAPAVQHHVGLAARPAAEQPPRRRQQPRAIDPDAAIRLGATCGLWKCMKPGFRLYGKTASLPKLP